MKKARKEGFLHPAISSNITLVKEKERKNRNTEEEETGFFEEKTAMATLLLDYFENKNAWQKTSICNLEVKFSKNLVGQEPITRSLYLSSALVMGSWLDIIMSFFKNALQLRFYVKVI